VTETIRSPLSEIRAAFEQWLASEYRAGTRLVVLEGHMQSGKTTLTKEPFVLDAGPSLNLELDDFRKQPIPEIAYIDTIDRTALANRLRVALASAPVVIVQGAIAWPLVEPIAPAVGHGGIRRVYLKRMMRNKPDFWVDEDFICDPALLPSHEPRRSIHLYQAEQRPWLSADLVLERIEEGTPLVRSQLLKAMQRTFPCDVLQKVCGQRLRIGEHRTSSSSQAIKTCTGHYKPQFQF